MSTLASLTVKLIGDISDFNSKMESASGRMRQTGQSMMGVGAGLTAGVSLPIAAVGIAAINAASQFESSMNMMQAVSGATADEMAQVSAVAMQLGADITLPGTSASDAAQAMTELARAGLTVQDSMDAARGVLELSAAAEISNSEAATITANALNSFGLAGTDAARVANLLAGGANASSAEIGDMAAGLQMASAVAASMGVPIEDLTTNLAQMANAGIAGSDAGTSLKTMLMRLAAPTDQAAGLMEDLGISVFDAQGQMLPMRSIIEQFSGAMSGMTMEQRNAALATIFGTDAIRAANVVLLDGVESFDAMKAAVTEEGAAHDLAATKMSGFSGALEGLKSTIETVLLTVGTPFLQLLTGIIQQVGAVIGKLTELDPKIIMIGGGFAALLVAIGPVITILGGVVTALGLIISPIGLVVAAIVGLGVLVVQHFGGIEQTITAVTGTVRNIMQALASFFQQNGSQITGWVDEAWTRVRSIIDGVTSAVQTIVTAIFGQIAMFIEAHGEEIKAFVLNAWERIGVIINLALELIQATVVPALRAIAQFISDHGAEIQAVFSVVWNAIKVVVDTVLTLIEGIIRAALAIIKGDWEGALTILQNTAQHIWDNIRMVIETVLEAISTFISEKWAQIKQAIETAMLSIKQGLIDKWEEIRSGIQTKLAAAKASVQARFEEMRAGIQDKMASVKQTVLTRWEETRAGIQEKLANIKQTMALRWGEMLTKVQEKWNEIKATILNIVGGLVTGLYERGRAMVQRFAQGIIDALHAAIDAARRLVEELRGLLPGSDAEYGPLSDLMASGRALPITFAKGIKQTSGVAAAAAQAMATDVAGNMDWTHAVGTNGPGVPVAQQGTVNLYIDTLQVRDKDDARQLAIEIANLLGLQAQANKRLNIAWSATA